MAAAANGAVPRAKIRNVVAVVTGALVLGILLYGATGDGGDPQEKFAKEKQEAAARANAGSGDDLRLMMKQQADEARSAELEKQKRLEREKQEANASVPPIIPANSGGSEKPNDEIAQLFESAGAAEVAGYEERKEAVSQVGKARARERIASAEWGDGDAGPRVHAQETGRAESGGHDRDIETLARLSAQRSMSDSQEKPSASARNLAFLKTQAEATTESTLAPSRASSVFLLQEGSVIPCVLNRDVVSDLPGQTVCRVSRNVYDSITGKHVLIPMGASAVGQYNSEVVSGQDRVLAAYQRLIFPNGASVRLGAMQGADRSGASGLPADVNNHFWAQFGSSFLVAGLAGLVRGRGGDNGGAQVVVETGGGGLANQAGQILVKVTESILTRNQGIQPTLTAKAGDKILLVVSRDLYLPPAITLAEPPGSGQ